MAITTESTLAPLAAAVRGDLITPADPGYDRARSVWNGMIDLRPAAILRARGAVDVVAAVNWARAHEVELAVRGGGHSSPGFSTCQDGLVLDLSQMRGVWVDAHARTARVQGGALWGDVDRETQAHGLAVPGGQISHTGVGGLTLGGGVGWLSRQHGLTIDNLRSVELVTAAGRLVTASAHHHPELFWAVRGGSGNFGVAVSFEYELHPVGPLVLGGPIVYGLADAAAAMANARDAIAAAPDEVALWMVVRRLPAHPPFPQAHWGELVLVVAPFCTDLERGPRLLEPFTSFGRPIANLHTRIPYAVLQSAMDDADPHGHRYWERGEYLAGLDDGLIETVIAAGRAMPSPLDEILLFPMGGAIARVPAGATAFGDRTAPWCAWIVGQWLSPADDDSGRDWVRAASSSIAPWTTGGVYINAVGEPDDARRVAGYGGSAKLERLRRVKRAWDPGNLFRRNHNIEPC